MNNEKHHERAEFNPTFHGWKKRWKKEERALLRDLALNIGAVTLKSGRQFEQRKKGNHSSTGRRRLQTRNEPQRVRMC